MDDDRKNSFAFDYNNSCGSCTSADSSYSITYSGSDTSATYDSDVALTPTSSIDCGDLNDTGTEFTYNDPASSYETAEQQMRKRLETIEKRLNILVPDPKKLEKFEALKKAYEHYKQLEQLCEIEDEEEKGPNW